MIACDDEYPFAWEHPQKQMLSNLSRGATGETRVAGSAVDRA